MQSASGPGLDDCAFSADRSADLGESADRPSTAFP